MEDMVKMYSWENMNLAVLDMDFVMENMGFFVEDMDFSVNPCRE